MQVPAWHSTGGICANPATAVVTPAVPARALTCLISHYCSWLAPEVLAGASASLQSDVYSFGVVLWGEFRFLSSVTSPLLVAAHASKRVAPTRLLLPVWPNTAARLPCAPGL